MKKVVFLAVFLISTFMISFVYSSSYKETYAVYQNKRIKFKAQYIKISGYRRDLKTMVFSKSTRFTLTAQRGYKILNISNVSSLNKMKKFMGKMVDKYYFKKGKTFFRRILNKPFTLTYFICKTGSDTCQRVTRKFKLVLKGIPIPHGRTKGKLVEIK